MANKYGQWGIKDLTGKKINSFLVKKRVVNRVAKSSGKEYVSWECVCDCTKVFITTTNQIRRGRKSCGCLVLDSQFRRKSDIPSNILKLISRYRSGATKRDLIWSLEDVEAYKLFISNCNYCDGPPSRSEGHLKNCPPILVTGIDRVDNNAGYFPYNCVSCCEICQRSKMDLPLIDFEKWVAQLVKFRGGK